MKKVRETLSQLKEKACIVEDLAAEELMALHDEKIKALENQEPYECFSPKYNYYETLIRSIDKRICTLRERIKT